MTPAWEQMLRSYRAPNVFNPWGETDAAMDFYSNASQLRYNCLMAHFDCKPRYLLIGEAPGYQGCRWTGVPFTSERQMCETLSIPRVSLPARITRRATSWAEPSATIVWRTLRFLGIHEQVVCWNAFPWNPHKPGEPYSNRTPTPQEVFGLENETEAPLLLLDGVIRAFPSAVIIAVGAVATEACQTLEQNFRKVHHVRHPANGGATKFREQLQAIVG